MYSLILTSGERQAFDWVGDRYNSGKVADLLMIAYRKIVSGATTATSRSTSRNTSPGRSTNWRRKRATRGHASPRNWRKSSTSFAGASSDPEANGAPSVPSRLIPPRWAAQPTPTKGV